MSLAPARSGARSAAVETPAAEAMYLELLKKSLTRFNAPEQYRLVEPLIQWGFVKWAAYRVLLRLLSSRRYHLVRDADVDLNQRADGRDRPLEAETMIGLRRLDNLQACVTDVVRRGVPGDLIEAGVWRGGATILMRAILKVHEVTDRQVWVADSFEGLPKPDEDRYPSDRGDRHWTFKHLAISVDEVRANFRRYDLLDDQVHFLKGWFADTLPSAPLARLAVLRIDADMYQSTMEALTYLYPKLSPGGYVIIDDYGAVPGCRRAVHDFRDRHRIADALTAIDWSGVFWRRGGGEMAP